VTLREAASILAQDQRHVGELGDGVVEALRNRGICLGVFDRWSSPRMTWVMLIVTSSTTTAEVVRGRSVRADKDPVVEWLCSNVTGPG